ncbi:MAG: glycosyltransferase family 4 protein [Bdellovibrionota bacterium]
MSNNSFAFVVPRYGKKIAGGCETLVREFAERLAKNGDNVDVLSTCAIDNRTWENALKEEEKVEDGVNVKRFLVDDRDLEKWIPYQIELSANKMISVDEQLTWMKNGVNSTRLYEYIKNNETKYRAIFFAPYLFGTTFWGSLVAPKKSILIPCLHDEIYAYTDIVASMFRQVRGCVFNALPEKTLAQSLYGEDIKGDSVGMGFILPKNEEQEALKPYFDDEFNYILYVGRKETGKNVHLLIDYFTSLKDGAKLPKDLKLVIAGGGSFEDLQRKEAKNREDIIDIGYVSEEDKQRLIKHSLLLCQPSVNESFSIVIMEAWGLRVPVLVNGFCQVTAYHVKNSEGGFTFSNKREFASSVNNILQEKLDNNSIRANKGYEYVKEKYNWDAIIKKFYKTVDGILS